MQLFTKEKSHILELAPLFLLLEELIALTFTSTDPTPSRVPPLKLALDEHLLLLIHEVTVHLLSQCLLHPVVIERSRGTPGLGVAWQLLIKIQGLLILRRWLREWAVFQGRDVLKGPHVRWVHLKLVGRATILVDNCLSKRGH